MKASLGFLDPFLKFDVLGGVGNIDLVFDLAIEINGRHTINDQIGLNFSTETTAVVLNYE